MDPRSLACMVAMAGLAPVGNAEVVRMPSHSDSTAPKLPRDTRPSRTAPRSSQERAELERRKAAKRAAKAARKRNRR